MLDAGRVKSPLTGKQRRFLRALAHELEPVVQIGQAGVTPGVLAEIGRALETHELVKIRVGRTLVVYRRRKKDPKIVLPKPTAKK